MTRSILTSEQKTVLDLFFANQSISPPFYLTGGTALCEYYLPYRYSEDLDFFSEDEVDLGAITTFIRSIKAELSYRSFDLNTSFNRNLVVLEFGGQKTLKLEFTYFPFPPIEKPKLKGRVRVDGVLDIATNKLFTIYQNPRSRDFIDLYTINKKYHYRVNFLVKQARVKFDWHVDPLKLGTQFLKARQLKDYPRLVEPLDHQRWQNYFEEAAARLKSRITKN